MALLKEALKWMSPLNVSNGNESILDKNGRMPNEEDHDMICFWHDTFKFEFRSCQVECMHAYIESGGIGLLHPTKYLSWLCNFKDVNRIIHYIEFSYGFRKLKALIFTPYEVYIGPLSENSMQNMLQEKMKAKNIFCHFPSHRQFVLYLALESAGKVVDDGEIVLIVQPEGPEQVWVNVVRRVIDEYQLIDEYFVPFIRDKKVLVSGILKDYEPAMIIVYWQNEKEYENVDESFTFVKKCFRGGKNVVITSDLNREERREHHIYDEMVYHLMEEKTTPYALRPAVADPFLVTLDDEVIFDIKNLETLPLAKTISAVMEENSKIKFRFRNMAETAFIGDQPKSGPVKITCCMDINAITRFHIEEDPNPVFQKRCKAKFVFENNEFSVFVEIDGKWEILKGKNGEEKIPVYISFAEADPIIGAAAKEMLKVKPTVVVYDLINVANLEELEGKNLLWPFGVTKDRRGRNLIEYENFKGEKVQEKVVDLLEHFFKYGKNLIENGDYGIPKKIEIEYKYGEKVETFNLMITKIC